MNASRFAFAIMEARSVGIVGVGMMGGSIALAALRAGYQVFLYDPVASEKLAGAKFQKASVVSDLAELVSNSRLIILATPIGALGGLGAAISELVGPHHVVSDVASVKRSGCRDSGAVHCEIAANMFLHTRWPARKSPALRPHGMICSPER